MFAKHDLLSPASYLRPIDGELSKSKKKKIVAMYTDFGGSAMSVQEIAQKLQVPKEKVKEYLNSIELTHQSMPFTPEDKKKLDSELSKKAEEVRLYKLQAKMETVEKDRLKTDALKWKTWKENVGNELFKILNEKVSKYEIPKLDLPESTNPFCAIFALQDFHLGRLASSSEVLDSAGIDEQIEKLIQCVRSLIKKTIGFGRPDKLYMTIGGDFINSDNSKLTTTNGTPQDSFPSHAELMLRGGMVLVRLIDLLRHVFPIIELVPTPGNHDRDTSISLYMFVAAWFRDCPQVITNWETPSGIPNVRLRQYKQYGKNLLAFMHGDGSKLKQWPIIIANEAREIWGQTDHSILVTGHKHFRISQDLFGMQHVQVPSMASEDRWSTLNGYQSEKSISFILVDSVDGYMAEIVSHAG